MKGQARILVVDDVIQLSGIEIKKPLVGCVIWDTLEAQELFDTLQRFLLLPDEYTIIGTFFDIMHYLWTVIIESDALPILRDGEMLPILHPRYQRTADGQVSLILDSLKLQEV